MLRVGVLANAPWLAENTSGSGKTLSGLTIGEVRPSARGIS